MLSKRNPEKLQPPLVWLGVLAAGLHYVNVRKFLKLHVWTTPWWWVPHNHPRFSEHNRHHTLILLMITPFRLPTMTCYKKQETVLFGFVTFGRDHQCQTKSLNHSRRQETEETLKITCWHSSMRSQLGGGGSVWVNEKIILPTQDKTRQEVF